jgi:hypothetical protein
MAPLPPESTARLWVDYNDGQHDHTLLMRYAPSAGLGPAMDAAAEFLGAVGPSLYLITVIGARAANSGSVISQPEAWTGSSTYGTGAMPAVSAPVELCFVGRTILGRMAKWFVYGWKEGVPGAFRFFPGDFAALDNGVAALRTAALAGTIVGIDGAIPSVYPYVNIQNNSYWETQARR